MNPQIHKVLCTHLYFAACRCGSTLLVGIEVFWKQRSDEGTVESQQQRVGPHNKTLANRNSKGFPRQPQGNMQLMIKFTRTFD